eukprot:CAMPEP_0181311558 /NCGR_PEP_ID=MMETSP1101-20121128/13205_1 /TAXON_ID=46948 /ORGANISM="Rhodomonas abbreviata, Strain Caron Lab Isolate" /LENGTH=141 /DNA_ID=CAMNT_0023418305 /DNA_START=163 /DNA_END=585 /DNA_ORIENTATION=+
MSSSEQKLDMDLADVVKSDRVVEKKKPAAAGGVKVGAKKGKVKVAKDPAMLKAQQAAKRVRQQSQGGAAKAGAGAGKVKARAKANTAQATGVARRQAAGAQQKAKVAQARKSKVAAARGLAAPRAPQAAGGGARGGAARGR